MRQRFLSAFAVLFLTACGVASSVGPDLTGLDVAARGGLSEAVAARPSVQLARPTVFVLTDQAEPFLVALEAASVPQRKALAKRLIADAAFQRGLAGWEGASAAGRMTVLERLAAIEAQVMGGRVPAIVLDDPIEGAEGMLATYQPNRGGLGTITVFGEPLARSGRYEAIAMMAHEMRHAIQYQQIQTDARGTPAQATLTQAFSRCWSALDELGGEGALAYGDYVHLNVEYDAFQTGNMVATLVSKGAYDAGGNGFATTQYASDATPALDLMQLRGLYSGTQLIAAVNRAEAQHAARRGGTAKRRYMHLDLSVR